MAEKSITEDLKIAQKRLISLTSSAPCDHIFRSQDGTSESVGKGSGIFGHLRQGRRKKRGEGWVGEGKKKRGRGGFGKDKKKGAEGGVGWVGNDVMEKNK